MFGSTAPAPDSSHWLPNSSVGSFGDVSNQDSLVVPHWMTQRPAKDPHWLTLEVCREFSRSKCNRADNECKFAHPPPNFDVLNGKVTCCFDALHNRCHRTDPPCKFFHPPEHLRNQLTAAAQSSRFLRNSIGPGQSMVPTSIMSQVGGMGGGIGMDMIGGGGTMHPLMATTAMPFMNPYLTQSAGGGGNAYSTSFTHIFSGGNQSGYGGAGAAGDHLLGSTSRVHHGSQQVGWMLPATMATYAATPMAPPMHRAPRSDKIEICREYQRGACARDPAYCRYAHPPKELALDGESHVTVCMDFVKGRCTRETCRYFHAPPHLQAQLRSVTSPPGITLGSNVSLQQQHRTPTGHTPHTLAMSIPQSLTTSMAALRLSSMGGGGSVPGMQPLYGSTAGSPSSFQQGTATVLDMTQSTGGPSNYHQTAALLSGSHQQHGLQQTQASYPNHTTSVGQQLLPQQSTGLDLTQQRF